MGSRDIDVVSMVLTLGWGGDAWVFEGSLFDVFSFLFGVIVLGGGFASTGNMRIIIIIIILIIIIIRRFRVAIFAVEKQKVLQILSLCL